MSFKTFLLLSLLIIFPSKSSTDVKDLVTSLLVYEEMSNRNRVCTPYVNYYKYPFIGYGQDCIQNKVQTSEELKQACSSYKEICTVKKAKEWLSDKIDKSMSCVQNKNNIKNAYNKATTYRKAILISMAFQLGCNAFSGSKLFLSYMAIGDWTNAANEITKYAWAKHYPERTKRYSYVIINNKCNTDFCKVYGWN